MIRVTDADPLDFERVIVDEVAPPLAEHGFVLEETMDAYRGGLVRFSREREGRREGVWFSRRFYDEKDMAEYDDEVDTGPDDPDFGRQWLSRHFLSVNFVSGGNSHLQTDGTLFQRGNDWWRFEDEDHLRRLLRDHILPLIRDVGLPSFDEVTTSAPDRHEVKSVLRENVA